MKPLITLKANQVKTTQIHKIKHTPEHILSGRGDHTHPVWFPQQLQSTMKLLKLSSSSVPNCLALGLLHFSSLALWMSSAFGSRSVSVRPSVSKLGGCTIENV